MCAVSVSNLQLEDGLNFLIPTLTYTNELVVPSKERVFINDNNTVFLGNVHETKIFHMKRNDTFFFYLWILETI